MTTPAPNINAVPWWFDHHYSNTPQRQSDQAINTAIIPQQAPSPYNIPNQQRVSPIHSNAEISPTQWDAEAYAQQRYYERIFQRPERTAKTKWEALQLMGIVPKESSTANNIPQAAPTTTTTSSSPSPFESMCDALEIPQGHTTVSMVLPERQNMHIPVSQSYYLGMRRGAQLDLYPDRERFNISTRMEGRKVFTRDDIKPNLPPF